MKNIYFISKHKYISLVVLVLIVSLVCFLSLTPGQNKNEFVNAAPTKPVTKDTSVQYQMNETINMNQMTLNSNIGYSVGGAKDIDNFRENIYNGFLPAATDITYEGLFYDYYFETGRKELCNNLFCPSYSCAVSKNPLTGETEYFLSIGLNSNINKSDFKRSKLNLVIVLDKSGSMGASLSNYYYDRFRRNNKENKDNSSTQTKLDLAKNTIVNLLKHLKSDDRFSFVVFDGSSELIIPLTSFSKLDLTSVKNKIHSINIGGSTNLESGYRAAMNQFESISEEINGYENRIIFITDDMPNRGKTGENSLLDLMKEAAKEKIYSTYLGMGVDFNTELTETLTKVHGANYYSVHSDKEFTKRLDDEFDYLVTPIVFNLEMKFKSDGFAIEKVYGSPEANESTGELMKVNTLFPSDNKDEQTRGGVIIVKLKKISDSKDINLTVTYEDRNGKKSRDNAEFSFSSNKANYFETSGIRKAVLLLRYAELMKAWLSNEKNKNDVESAGQKDNNNNIKGVKLNKWERQSNALSVPQDYKKLFASFKTHFESEMKIISDTTMGKEDLLLDKLCKSN